jgi:hypothetical protein
VAEDRIGPERVALVRQLEQIAVQLVPAQPGSSSTGRFRGEDRPDHPADRPRARTTPGGAGRARDLARCATKSRAGRREQRACAPQRPRSNAHVSTRQELVNKVVGRHGGTRSSVIGIAASLALVIGYFLPWTATSGAIKGALGFDARATIASRSSDPGTRAAAERLAAGKAATGAQWAAILDAAEKDRRLEPRQQRAIEIARVGIEVLPYAAGALTILMLALAVAPGRAARLGMPPMAAVLAIAQTRFVSGFLLVLTLALAMLVFAVTGLLWSSAELAGDADTETGEGLWLMIGGSGVAFLSAFFGYGPGRLRAVIWAMLLVAGFCGFVAWFVTSS